MDNFLQEFVTSIRDDKVGFVGELSCELWRRRRRRRDGRECEFERPALLERARAPRSLSLACMFG